MKSACLILLVIGMTHAAMQQQQRSPVYPSSASSGINASNGPASAKTSLLPSQSLPASQPAINQPTAQAREGQGAPETAAQPGTPGTSPSQNYLVYYYPNEFRNAPTQTGGAQAYNSPNKVEGSGIMNWSGWREVGYAGSAVVLVLAGGGLLYNVFGAPIKTKVVRSLKEMNSDDVARVARNVLKSIEKFRDMASQ